MSRDDALREWIDLHPGAAHSVTECRSEQGVTVGLIDTILNSARLLAGRNLNSNAVRQALSDLSSDGDLRSLLQSGGTSQ
jgi:hypothetical protein